mgnify:CR=1 FL=1
MAPAPLLNTAEQEPHNQSTFKDQHRELPTHQECDSTIAYLKPPTHFYLDWLRLFFNSLGVIENHLQQSLIS